MDTIVLGIAPGFETPSTYSSVHSMSLHVLVLAAGASTRLGQPKQLVKLGGRPALHIVVSNAVALAGNAVTVVVGAHAREMTHLLAHSPASVIVNRSWEEGMSSSLRFGVASLPPGCDAVLVLLGDQVGVNADDLKRLAAAWKGEESLIAASVYDQHVGVPAIFPRLCFSELSRAARRSRCARGPGTQQLSPGARADGERRDRSRHAGRSRCADRTFQSAAAGMTGCVSSYCC